AELEIRLDPLLEAPQPQLLEPSRLGLRELVVPEVGERRPTPQRERLAQRAGGGLAVEPGGLAEEPLEPRRVEVVGIEAQHVAAGTGLHRVVAETLPQLGDVPLERLSGGLRGR